jgi:hypothetical protein
MFDNTDLGLAISKGLEFLEREGASKVQAFFLLTDGLHRHTGKAIMRAKCSALAPFHGGIGNAALSAAEDVAQGRARMATHPRSG